MGLTAKTAALSGASLFALVSATGCLSTLTPPRTVPQGKTRSYLLVEESNGLPAPRYMVRHGISSRVDVGLQVGAMAGADVKWNAARGVVDAAWDPGVTAWLGPSIQGNPRPLSGSTSANSPSGSLGSGAATAIVGAPVLLGLNLARWISIIALGGTDLVLRDGERPHVLYRAGAGVNFRTRRRFSLQVEADALRDMHRPGSASLAGTAGGERPAWVGVFGVGFAFGHSSEYDDTRR